MANAGDAFPVPRQPDQPHFSISRKGFDQAEVQQWINDVNARLRQARAEIDALRRQLIGAGSTGALVDEDALIDAVGAEMAETLRNAHHAARELRTNAAAEAESLVQEARAEATALVTESARDRSEAAEEAERVRSEAIAEAEQLRSEAAAQADHQRSSAIAEAEQLRSEAAAELERARTEASGHAEKKLAEATAEVARIAEEAQARASAEAEDVVGRARAEAEETKADAERQRRLTLEGAHAARERILADLSRRRRVAAVQIEQLRAGRERLAVSYAVVRRTLEEVHEEFERADTEARAAADEAGKRLAHDTQPEPLADVTSGEVPAVTAGEGPDGGEAAQGEGAQGGAVQEAGAGGTPDAGTAGEGGDATSEPAAGDEGQGGPKDSGPASGAPPSGPGPSGGTEPAGGPRATTTQTAPASEGRPAKGRGPARRLRERGPTRPGEASTSGVRITDAQVATAVEAEAPASRPDRVAGLFDRIRAGRERAPADEQEPTNAAPAGGLIESVTVVGAAPAAEETPAAQAAPTATEAGPPTEAAAAVEADGAPAGDPPAGDHDSGDHDSGDDAGGRAHTTAEDELLQRRDAAVATLQRDLTRRLKRAMQDEQNAILDRLRGSKGTLSMEQLAPTAEEQSVRYAGIARSYIEGAAQRGVELATDLVPQAEAVTADTAAVLDDLAEAIVTPLRRRIEAVVEELGDEDHDAVVEALGSVYREAKTQRVERIAADHVSTGFGVGTWSALPEGTLLRWIAADADGPCPDCDDNTLAGDVARGESFPTGQLHPPAHDGCRCLLVPAVAAPAGS